MAGNVEADKTTANALRILDLIESDIPVYRGAADGLVVKALPRATSHGKV